MTFRNHEMLPVFGMQRVGNKCVSLFVCLFSVRHAPCLPVICPVCLSVCLSEIYPLRQSINVINRLFQRPQTVWLIFCAYQSMYMRASSRTRFPGCRTSVDDSHGCFKLKQMTALSMHCLMCRLITEWSVQSMQGWLASRQIRPA